MNFEEKYKAQRNKPPGKVPEGFFEDFKNEMTSQSKSGFQKKSGYRAISFYISAAAAVVMLFWIILKPGTESNSGNNESALLVNETLHNNEGMTDLTQNVIEKIDTTNLKKIQPVKKAVMDTVITEDDILEFLLDEGYDET